MRGYNTVNNRLFKWIQPGRSVPAGNDRYLAASAVLLIRPILSYALSFAAGGMIIVVVAELITKSNRASPDLATLGAMAGFVTMMVLDAAFG